MKKRKIVSWVLALGMLVSGINTTYAADTNIVTTTNHYSKGVFERKMEKLSRGLVAIRTETGTFISWRLFDSEDTRFGSAEDNVEFNIYREHTKIATVSDATNYLDEGTVGRSMTYSYSVAPVINGVEGEKCEDVEELWNSYFDIPIDIPVAFVNGDETHAYYAGDASCGDVDGDGEYEIIVKWEANAKDNSQSGVTGNVYLDAYEMDGTKLWRIDLGRNIRSGAHYTQFLVYDFDLDGKAEVACKTAPGSLDGAGNYVSAASSVAEIKSVDNTAVYINDGGYILEGDEYYTVFNGETGAAIDTIYYPVDRYPINGWGNNESYGNRVDRFVGGVAYLDGVTPSIISVRGYYGRTTVAAMNLENGKLVTKAIADTNELGVVYEGQGNHNLTVADVDGDGKDEVILGSICFDDDMSVLWCSYRGHGDALHIGDYDPTHPGLEFFSVHESYGYTAGDGITYCDGGMSVLDAATGEELFHNGNGKDQGRGVMANVGAGGYYQFWGAGTYKAMGNGEFAETTVNSASSNFRVFWDGDLYDELLDGTGITAWNGSKMSSIFSATDCTSVNGTKANPSLQADLFGDWREEVVYSLKDNSALRVYTTTIPTEYKIKTLMHDSVYRSGVAAEQSAYNQPPHIGFYLSDDLFKSPLVDIEITAPEKTTYELGEELDLTGLEVVAVYENGEREVVDNYSVTGYDKYVVGKQAVTVDYRAITKTFDVTVSSGFTINSDGYITGYTQSKTEITLPKSINGTKVAGIADNALSDTLIKKLTVIVDELNIGANAFAKDMTLICYENSDADFYATENGVTVEYIPSEEIYIAQAGYEEDDYNGISWLQTNTTQTNTINDITYTVGGRNRGGGDGQTGFVVVEDGANSYLQARYGRFANNGRNASIKVDNAPTITGASTVVLSMDLYFESSDLGDVKLVLNDGTNDIATVDYRTLGSEDEWYNYSIMCQNGKYIQTVKKADGTIVNETNLSSEIGDSMVSNIAVLSDNSTAHNNQYVAVRIDNISMSTPTMNDVEFNVRNAAGTVIEGAKVKFGGVSGITDEFGKVILKVKEGRYTAEITADDYKKSSTLVSARQNGAVVDIVLAKEDLLVTDISLAETMTVNKNTSVSLNVKITPTVYDEEITYTSSDNKVVEILADGYIKAIGVGTATVTVKSAAGVSASCVVTVVENAVQTATTIAINGRSNVYKSADDIVTTDIYTAEVYDQNGAVMQVSSDDIEWSIAYSNVEVAQKNGKYTNLKIKPNADVGTMELKAAYGTVTATIQIAIEDAPVNKESSYSLTFDEAEFSNVNLVMQAEGTSVNADNVTFGVGGRNGGDNSTSISVTTVNGDKVVAAVAGRFSNNGRNTYMVLDNAPTLSNNTIHVMEFDMYFPTTAQEAAINIGDGSNTVTRISPATKGFSQNKWYHYMVVYSDGVFTEYITDPNGTEAVITNQLSATASKLSRLDFTGPDGASSPYPTVYVNNLDLYTTDSLTSNVVIKVYDNNGNAIEGATVEINNEEYKTNAVGAVNVELFNGVYNAVISLDSKYAEKTVLALGESARYNVYLDYAEAVEVEDNVYTISSPCVQKANVIYAVYKDGVMTECAIEEILIPEGQSEYAGKKLTTDDDTVKRIFIWSSFSDMVPILNK